MIPPLGRVYARSTERSGLQRLTSFLISELLWKSLVVPILSRITTNGSLRGLSWLEGGVFLTSVGSLGVMCAQGTAGGGVGAVWSLTMQFTFCLIVSGDCLRKQRIQVNEALPLSLWLGARLEQPLCHHCKHKEQAVIRVFDLSSPHGHTSRSGFASSWGVGWYWCSCWTLFEVGFARGFAWGLADCLSVCWGVVGFVGVVVLLRS